MLTIKKTARSILAIIISLTIAATFYPATAFAGTDYEAAYNQAHVNTQAAYQAWQNAITDRDTKEIAYNQAKADYDTAKAATETARQDMLKQHRILDWATRNAIDDLARKSWQADFGTSTPHIDWYCDTEARIQAISSREAYSQTNWHRVGPDTNPEYDSIGYYNEHKTDTANLTKYGFTTSSSGTDDSASLDLYTKYVYYNESYDILMRSLACVDELNQVRRDYQNDPYFKGSINLLVSPHLMMQAMVNAPINNSCGMVHRIITSSGSIAGVTNGQNLLSLSNYGNYEDIQTTHAMMIAERPEGADGRPGGHYVAALYDWTHIGVAWSHAANGAPFEEQDFAKTPGKTGYTVAEYKKAINNKIGSYKTAYENAKSVYEQKQADATEIGYDKDAALYDWSDAKTIVAEKQRDYDKAVAAEAEAKQAYENWLNNGSGSDNDGSDNPGGTDPGNDNPSNPGITVTEVGAIAQISVSNGGKDGNEYIINVSWATATNANKYEVFEKVGSESYTLKTTTQSRSVQFTTTSPNTTFKYQVRGVYQNGSTTIYGNVTTSSAYTTPVAETPSVTLAKVTSVIITETGWNSLNQTHSVKVSWNLVANANKYNVYKAINSNYFELADTVGGSTNILGIKNIPYGGTIKCKVAAVDINGNEGPMSDVATLITSSSDGISGQTSDDQAQTTDPTQPSDPDEQIQPTDQTQPTAPVYARSYLKSFKVVKGKKSFTAKWKKQSKANQKKFSGYQIRYSLKKNMKGARYVTAKKSAKYKKIKRLKTGKKYYVQARTFTVIGGVKHYSKWSVKKAVKTR